MPLNLNRIFTTITADPMREDNYIEIEPCDALKPYIKCYWGSRYNKADNPEAKIKKTLVIPDVCMDIIITGSSDFSTVNSHFCGINNFSYTAEETDCYCFGIRFYAWSAVMFSDESMKSALNIFSDIEVYFSGFKKQIESDIVFAKNIYERKAVAEKFLLSRLATKREDSDLMNSLYFIVNNNGKASVKDLSDFCFISKRQLERKFLENTGVSPKQMINLIRYQLLWQECIKTDFNIHNCVEKFGYCDQSHLLKEFKKYHGLSLGNARNNVIKMSRFYNTNLI